MSSDVSTPCLPPLARGQARRWCSSGSQGSERPRCSSTGQLFLSPKTIEWHLGHVYRKLGIGSRAELARMVAQQAVSVRPAAQTG
jgi:hypothetical protein